MAREARLKVAGLVTNPNQLDPLPGALSVATNVVVDRPNVIRPRRGYESVDTLTDSRTFTKMLPFQGSVLVHWEDSGGDEKLSYWDGSNFQTFAGTVIAPTGKRLRTAVVAENLITTSSTGLLRTDSYVTKPAFAGAPKSIGFDPESSSLATETAGILTTERQVAYRSCLSVEDAFGRVIRGSPSGRLVMRNTSAADNKKPTVRALLPKKNGTASTDLTTDYTLSIYRSSLSASLTADVPEDEALVYEAKLTSAQITAGYVDFEDTTPQEVRGTSLLENAYNDGILQSNEPPPFAHEVLAWKGCLLGLNTLSRRRIEFSILAVGGTYGIQDTDTLTISDGTTTFTVTAKTTPAASTDYKIESGISTTLDIQLTAQNLCAAINRHASNTLVYAYYVGVPSDPRSIGAIVLEARTLTEPSADVAITITTGSGDKTDCFEPQITSSGISSTANHWPDGWFLSKPGQPDAVPILNDGINIGRLGSGEEILCAASLGDTAFIFTNRNTWRLSGEPSVGAGDLGTFRFEQFRAGLRVLATESVQVLGGAIYALTNHGVVAINDGGVQVVSGDIKDQIDALNYNGTLGGTTEYIEARSFAIAHETERRYILWATGTQASTSAGSCFVFHVDAGMWSQWSPFAAAAGVYDSATDKLWFARNVTSGSGDVYRERKTNSPGDDHKDGESAFNCSVTWFPVIEPHGVGKQFQSALLLFESGQPSSITATFTTDFSNGSVTLATQSVNLGRIPIPQVAQRGHKLSVGLVMSSAGGWALGGLVVYYRPYGERVTK